MIPLCKQAGINYTTVIHPTVCPLHDNGPVWIRTRDKLETEFDVAVQREEVVVLSITQHQSYHALQGAGNDDLRRQSSAG